MATPRSQRPVGRPSKYKPAFCSLVMELGREGASQAEMAEACDVHATSLVDWAEKFPEFADALARARQAAMVYWEKIGRENLYSKQFQSAVYNKLIASRFPEQYSERHQFDINHNTTVRHELTADRDLARELALLLAESGQGVPMIDVTPRETQGVDSGGGGSLPPADGGGGEE